MERDLDCDVLICGLGPVGQLLALLLGDLGVRTVAIDQAGAPYDLPRAAVIDDEVLRIFQSVGVADAVLEAAQIQQAVTFLSARRRAYEVFRPVDGELGHPPLVSIHQPSIERTLVAELERRGDAELRWDTVLETIDQTADGVTAWVRATPTAGPPANGTASPTSGSTAGAEPIRARYLVGCDGGRSTVRSLLQIPFTGSSFAQRWLVVDVELDRPLDRAPHPHFAGDPARPTVCLPMSPGRHRWEWMLHPGEDAEPFLDRTRIRELMAPWLSGERPEIERAVVYTFHARTAERWRSGRVLLAGDAAHVMPPFVGQGFSSGARDAGNLAWKLDALLHGSPASLLDSYEAERRPHTTGMQHFAVRWGAIVQTTNPRVGRVRDATMELLRLSGGLKVIRGSAKPLPAYGAGAFAWRPSRIVFGRTVGSLFPQPAFAGAPLDDALGNGWAAISADPGATTALRAAGLLCIESPSNQWLSRRNLRWAILRPDRYVFACGTAERLSPALAALRVQIGDGLRSATSQPAITRYVASRPNF